MIGARRVWLLLPVSCVASAGALAGQQVRVTSNLPANGYVDPDFAVEISVAGAPADGERIAVLMGSEDVSALLTPTSGGYRYASTLLGLPIGRGEMAVYRVDAAGAWHLLQGFPMRVRSELGVEDASWSPKLDLTFSGQPAEGETPVPADAAVVPEILDGKADLDVELEHRGFTLRASALVVGTSEENRRLRYRDLAGDAPSLDLSSYHVEHEQGPVKIAVGHVRAGGQRHLIDGFGARGAAATVRPSRRVDLAVAATAGSQDVGWSNLVGLGDGEHRVLSASMGVEALPRPGRLRMEVGWMDGSVLPRSGFNQGAVVDAETSNGVSLRLMTNGLGRLRLDAGWARSTFDNPADAELAAGRDLVEVDVVTTDARYADATLDVVRGWRLGGSSKTAQLSVGVKHERVDPLYRTVGTSVRADNLQNQLDVRAAVAGIAVTGSFSTGEDNLDEIASILKSNTDRGSIVVSVPLAGLAGGRAWLPALEYRNDRTHQFGVGTPTNGGFTGGHVPDQLSVSQAVAVEWRASRFSVRYRLDKSEQDNRQEGRETADFETLANGLGVSVDPARSLQLSLDLGLDRSDDLGAAARDNTRKYGVNGTWRPFARSALSLRFSHTYRGDAAETKEQTGRTLDVKWSSQIPKASALGGTYFVRFNRTESGRVDRVRDQFQDRTRWTVNVGASLGLQNR